MSFTALIIVTGFLWLNRNPVASKFSLFLLTWMLQSKLHRWRFRVNLKFNDEFEMSVDCSWVIGRERQIQVDQHRPRRNVRRTDRVLSGGGQRRRANDAHTNGRTSRTIQEKRLLVSAIACSFANARDVRFKTNPVSSLCVGLSPYAIFFGWRNHL